MSTTTTETLDSSRLPPASAPSAADQPMCGEMPLQSQAPEHAWLQRFVGEWDAEIELCGDTGRPSMKSRGSERARILGGFWLLIEGRNEEFPYVFQLTLGYDVGRGSYVGTWVDSMSSHLWHYTGALDARQQTLTMETTGPFPPGPGGVATQFREVTEFQDDDHRVFTSMRLTPDGTWQPLLRIAFSRRGEA